MCCAARGRTRVAEYPLFTVIAIVLVVLAELAWFRTGIFRSVQYWLSILIVWVFQILVDGWLTKLSAFPWDIPIEDFGFGWAMVTLTILVWTRLGRTERR